ncbi:MAG: sugar phosphate isomerase/epimerase [Opitutus sp.]|nr:sugar phosphate isomerase/epimerase [Opitutus sp.]
MPKLGFNLLAWSASISDDLYPHIERLKKIGYDGIEICNGQQDPAAYKRLNTLLGNLDLGVTCVTIVGADANPVSPDKAVRAKALDALKWNIDRTAEVGSKMLCGPIHSAFATFTRAEPKAEEYQRSAEVLHAAGDYAKQAGVILVPEAINRFECYLCNTMAQLRSLIELTDHPNVRGMFDTHHANIEEKSQVAAIKTIAPVLVHVHLSENDRGTPGSGHINFREALVTLKEVGYDGWMTVEAFSRSDPSFANAINVWREFSPAWDIAESGHAFLRREIAAAGYRAGA